jgi:hypothetical protein
VIFQYIDLSESSSSTNSESWRINGPTGCEYALKVRGEMSKNLDLADLSTFAAS